MIDADRILVMEGGHGREFDHPFKLLANEDADSTITKTNADGKPGFFAEMVRATGPETATQLFEIAKSKYMAIN